MDVQETGQVQKRFLRLEGLSSNSQSNEQELRYPVPVDASEGTRVLSDELQGTQQAAPVQATDDRTDAQDQGRISGGTSL